MKIYDTQLAPNPRRVRIFLAEKGIDMEYAPIDLAKGEHLTDEFKAKTPYPQVPLLELDDGRCLSETVAICLYFEQLHPEPALMGGDAWEQAQVEMWNRRIELNLFYSILMAFRHTSGYFAQHEAVFEDWGNENIKRAQKQMALLDKHLADNTFIAGETYSIADITAICALDFAKVVKLRVSEELPRLHRWYQSMQARPSYRA